MFPREHGAYNQLLFPLIAALAVGRPGAAAFTFAAAAVFAFLAHEPLLVLLGQRGPRARHDDGPRAMRWFAATGLPAAGLAVFAIATMPRVAQHAVIFCSVLAAMLLAVIATRREHTMAGEILSACVLASLALPVALASHTTHAVAVTCVLVFAAAFTTATVCVRAVIMHTRRPPAIASRIAGALTACGAIAILVFSGAIGFASTVAPWAALPVCAAGVVLVAAPPSARQLRIVGWTLVATTAAAAAILIAVFG
ncbi:MAG: YwiC-like family protein [Acidobacteria bacterium]|nr:YwiC-like family protein [Acidobacteriota bacterium]